MQTLTAILMLTAIGATALWTIFVLGDIALELYRAIRMNLDRS